MRLRRLIIEETEKEVRHEQYKDVLSSFTWQDVDFIEGDIEMDKCERLYVTVKGIEIPVDIINLKAQQTRIGRIQLHIFINPDFQGLGIGSKIYNAFVHQFGGVYSGFKRIMNKAAILGIYDRLSKEDDIDVHYIKNSSQEVIGVEATLRQ